MSCGHVFKPSIHGGQFSGHDEILISESEMQRVFSLGENRVNCLFIKITVVIQASFKDLYLLILFDRPQGCHAYLYLLQ